MHRVALLRRLALLFVALVAGALPAALPAAAQPYLYWTDPGTNTIARANLDGSQPNLSFITGASTPSAVTANATHLFWTNQGSGTIGRARLDGTDVNQSFITGTNAPSGVAVNATHLYWTNANWNTIGRASIDGTDVNRNLITADRPRGVTVNATHVFWTNSSTFTIGRAKLDGTEVKQNFIVRASEPYSVTVNATHIFWANFGGHTIGRARIDGTGSDQEFINDASYPSGVTVNATHIFWTNPGESTIGRANLDGTDTNWSFLTGANRPTGVVASNSSDVSLPVELAAFTAAASGRSARLAWTTASETGNAGFTVEHQSGDAQTGAAWRDVSGLIAGRGTTSEAHSYSYAVEGLTAGRHRFRLRQRDTDGTLGYSPTVTVEIGVEAGLHLTVLGARAVRVESGAGAEVTVVDMLGRLVERAQVPAGAGEVRLGTSVGGGAYVVRAVAPGGRAATARLVVR